MRELATEIHRLNHRWWHTQDGTRLDRCKGEMLMLVVSELSEGMEGLRKNLMDTHIPHRPMIEVEMADTYIRLLDYIAGHDYLCLFDVNTNPAAFDSWFHGTQANGLFHIVSCVTRARYNIDYLVTAVEAVEKFCAAYGYDLLGAVREKLEYNKTRADHTYEARAAIGGKEF